MKRSAAISILLLCFAWISVPAQIQFFQKLDSTSMLIGDQQHLSIVCSDPQTGDKAFTVLDTLSWLYIVDKGNWLKKEPLYERNILFTVFDSGYFTIPSLIHLDTLNKLGNPLYLKVDYPADSLQVLRPIKSIEETTNPSRLWLGILIGILFIAAMLFVLWQFFKADRIKPGTIQIPSEKTVWQKSLDDLAELESRQLWQNHKIKEFYDVLNHILRNYLSAGLKIPALENTSQEIIDYILKNQIQLDHVAELSSCFRDSDLVKFANYQPATEKHRVWMEFAIEFIKSHAKLSEKILEDNRITFIALLGDTLGNQFEQASDTVPDELIHLYHSSRENRSLELVHHFINKTYFELPEEWVKWQEVHTGSFYRWHLNILGIAKHKFIQLVILLFVLPFIALFLPFMWFISKWKKQNLFARGVFGLSKNNKLVMRHTS